MSSKGSAFAGDGREYLQEPHAKQARYEHHPAQPHVIEGEGKKTTGVWAGKELNTDRRAALCTISKRMSSLPSYFGDRSYFASNARDAWFAAVTDESNPTVPVPQSDFEIEINSTSQV